MTKTLIALGVVTIFAASAAAQQPPTSPPPVTRIQTNEGSVLNGAIGGGMVTVRTTFGGDVRIDGRRIAGYAGTTLTLDDGSTFQGTLTAGALQFATTFGTLAIPVDRITEIQVPKAPAATMPPAAAPAARTPAAVPAPAAKPAAPAKATVQIVNDTRRNLSVCVNDERPCLQIGPNGSTNRTMDPGSLRLRVESTTQLGFVVVATGSFEKTVAVDKDTTVRVTESDFR